MRTNSVALGVVCAVVAVAGCVGVSGPATPTAATPSEPTATPPPGVTPGPYSAELAIENPSRWSVTVKASEQSADDAPTTADTLVVNRTTDERRVDLDDAFEPGTDYRVVVTVDGTTRWNGVVYAYESYTLSVGRNGTVRLVELTVE